MLWTKKDKEKRKEENMQEVGTIVVSLTERDNDGFSDLVKTTNKILKARPRFIPNNQVIVLYYLLRLHRKYHWDIEEIVNCDTLTLIAWLTKFILEGECDSEQRGDEQECLAQKDAEGIGFDDLPF